MKTYRVVVTQDARDDLERIVDYIVNDLCNPIAASRVLDDYENTINHLSFQADSLPLPSNQLMRDRGYKICHFHHYAYYLIYRIHNDTVEIINILHNLEDAQRRIR